MTSATSTLPALKSSEVIREQNEAPLGLFEAERNYRLETEGKNYSELKSDNEIEEEEEEEVSHESPQYEGTAEGTPEKITTSQQLSSFKMNRNPITIQVLNPVPKDGKFDKYVIYTIKGSDKDGNFEVTRTQHQFTEIRSLLVQRWPGCYVPAIPPKRMLTKTTADFLEQRRKQYEMFCQKMSEIPYLHYSAEYQLFLKSTSENITFELNRFPKTDYVEIMSRLDLTFTDAIQREITNKTTEKIEHFKDFLEKTKEPFKKYKKILKSIAKARRKYLSQFANLQESIATGFETNILKGFEDPIDHHPIARGDKNKIFDLKESVGKIRITSSVDPIEFLHAWMKSEEKEVEGFLDSIRQRDNLIMLRGKILEKQKAKARELDKVANGSITLKTLFSMKGKAIEMDTMEKQIANFNKEVELLKMLIEKVTLILAYTEIDKFRRKKAEQYHQVITMASQNEIIKLKDMTAFWSYLLAKNELVKNNINYETVKTVKSYNP